MQILRTYLMNLLMLSCAALLLTGFSWGTLGLGGDKCKDAMDSAVKLEGIRDEAQLRLEEAGILSKCPDGAAANYVNALQLERVGNIDGAIEEYRKAVKKERTFSLASGNLGLLYAQKGMYDEASVELARGLSSVPNPKYHKAMALILADRKVYPLAVYHFKEAERELTQDASIFLGLAEIYRATGKQERALEDYRRALSANPSLVKAYIGIAAISLERNDPDSAIEQLKKAEVTNPQNREIHLMLASIYEKRGDIKLAEYHYLLGGKGKSTSTASGQSPEQMSGSDKEIEALKIDVKKRPDNVSSYEKLGNAYRAAGKDTEAIEAYREAAHLNSMNSDIYLHLGALYEKHSQADEAVVAYKRAIKVNPDNFDARLKLGDIRFSRGFFQEAVEQYSEFLRLRPESPDIHLKLARIFAKSKETNLAIESYRHVLRYSPDDADANREIAALYRAKGQNDKAIEHYKKVLSQHKNDAETRAALVSIYVKNKQYDEITLLLKEAVELNPDDPNNHYKLGLIYDFKKDYDNAMASYKKAIEIKPDNARSLNALGRLYMKTGRLSEARDVLEAAKKADPTMEETAILLNNIRDEFNPEPRKISKGKKGKIKKSKKSSKTAKKSKKTKPATPGAKKTSATKPAPKTKQE
ncbi:MAG: tetratricopeptide repeat protein [Desulfuromonadaceae bacterium]|nr:tetratricopeptide repeat protein [Desulfuromonadaceae bacterium]